MKQKRKSKMREDSPEQIAACLDCPLVECSNCLVYKPTRPGKPRKTKSVIAFRDGEEDMVFDSADDAADFFHVTAGAIRTAVREKRPCSEYFWRYENG